MAKRGIDSILKLEKNDMYIATKNIILNDNISE